MGAMIGVVFFAALALMSSFAGTDAAVQVATTWTSIFALGSLAIAFIVFG